MLEQVHPGAVRAAGAAAGFAVHRDGPERGRDRRRGQRVQPGVQHRVEDVGVDHDQDSADRGQARAGPADPHPGPSPYRQVRGPAGDRSQGPRAGYDGRDRQDQDVGQLVTASAAMPGVGDRGQHVPDRDRHVMNRANVGSSEGISGADERRYRCGHGRIPIDRLGR